ncbi:MAG TPA: hypothetical protein VGN12_14255 [Pirellulales bacterium]
MTFAEIVGDLHRHHQIPGDGEVPAIFVADPWDPSSEATVEGAEGVPLRRKPILFYLTTVAAALRFFGTAYDGLVENDEVDAMCRKLAHHIAAMNAQGERHDIDIEPASTEGLSAEFSSATPNRASSTKGFTVIFHPAGGVDYADAIDVARVDSELYVKPLRVALYRESKSLQKLTASRANEILTNIVRAMAFLGHLEQPTEIV